MGSTELNKPRIVGAVMLWTLTILELLGMGLAGMAKFQGDVWREMFLGWGYAPWFAFVIGAAEVAGALALLIPSVASYAASMLIVIMSGAIWTVAASTNETGLGPGLPAIHIAVLSIILYARRGRRWRPKQAGERGSGGFQAVEELEPGD